MSILEMIALGTCLVCCSGGIIWLLYDMDKQLKYYKKIEEESTLGLVEDEDEE